MEGGQALVPRPVPRLPEDEVLDRDQLQRPVLARLVDQDGRLSEINVGAVAVDPRIWRSGDPEQVRAEEMDAHSAERPGAAHHRGGLAHVGGVADIAFGQSDFGVLEAGGGGPDLVEGGLARAGRGRGQNGGDDR